MKELLKELCLETGIPGREQKIIDIMLRELKETCDEVLVDPIGNAIGVKKSLKKDAKTLMIAGHMDEIGFVVSHIDKNGFIRFSPRGGHVGRVLISQRVQIVGKKNKVIGIVEGSPAFLDAEGRGKVPEFKHMFIDTGLNLKELSKLVEVGDPIVMCGDFIEQGQNYISKAFDNRVGCYMVLEAMRRLEKKKLNINVLAVGTVQEEVGCRGAKTASSTYTPDLGIALDVTAAFDTPGVAEHEQVSKLGSGVAIKINDQGTISNHGIVEHLKDLAKKNKIKFQTEILPFGGTDASGMQLFGKGAVGTLSIPTRFVHSPNEIINKNDLEAGIKLLCKFIETADKVQLLYQVSMKSLFLLSLFFFQAAEASQLRWIIGESNTMPLARIENKEVKEGILKEVAESLAKDLKQELVFVVLPRGRVIEFLKENKADGLCYIRPEWFEDDKNKLQWTDLLFTNREIIVQHAEDKKLSSFKDLKGATFGTVLNYNYRKLESLIGETVKRSDAPNMSSNFLKLENNRVDYAVTDEFSYRYFLSNNKHQKQKLSSSVLVVDDLEIRCALSKRSSLSLAQVNLSLGKMHKNGQIEEVLKKYLGPSLKLKYPRN